MAVQLDVLVDEGEGPFQAHSVDVAQVLPGVAAADAPGQPVAQFRYRHGCHPRRLRTRAVDTHHVGLDGGAVLGGYRDGYGGGEVLGQLHQGGAVAAVGERVLRHG